MKKLIIVIVVVVGLITTISFHVGYLTARIHDEKTISELNEKIEAMNIDYMIFFVTYRNGENDFVNFDQLVDDLKYQRIAAINYTGYAEITNPFDEITED